MWPHLRESKTPGPHSREGYCFTIVETLTHARFISGGRNCSRIIPASSAIVSPANCLIESPTRNESLRSASSRYKTRRKRLPSKSRVRSLSKDSRNTSHFFLRRQAVRWSNEQRWVSEGDDSRNLSIDIVRAWEKYHDTALNTRCP